MSGLTAARDLTEAEVDVVVFDRGRGPGGRASRTRREGYTFDHGAQYFTARGEALSTRTADWESRAVAAEWHPRLATAEGGVIRAKTNRTTRYVGIPGMSALCRDLAAGLEVRTRTTVRGVSQDADGLMRVAIDMSEDTPGSESPPTASARFDAVVLATPPQQTLPLLAFEPSFAAEPRGVRFEPTWALLLAFDRDPGIDVDGIFFNDERVRWAARDGSKPGREHPHTWVVHATGTWSAGRTDAAPADVAVELRSAFASAVGSDLPTPVYAAAHRWKYARAQNPLRCGALWDGERAVGMCGDWCASSRIEGAFESGRAAASAVMRHFGL
jgi:hypothetical protein